MSGYTFAKEQRFGVVNTGQRGLEENTATCNEDGTSRADIPTIHGVSSEM